MMLKSSFTVDLCALKIEYAEDENFSLLITSQAGKAHSSCESHLGIVKHFKEHGNINCCVRSRASVPITSIEVIGYLGTTSHSIGKPEVLTQIPDYSVIDPSVKMKSFCKRKTHSGYRIASLVERNGVKEIDYSGRNLKTNEPFELDIFSISNSATSVIYCILVTIKDYNSLNGEGIKIISLPLCVHAKKSDDRVEDFVAVYQSSTLHSTFLSRGVISSTVITLTPDNCHYVLGSKRYDHVIDWAAKSVNTTSSCGGKEKKVVYTLSKERQNGQKRPKEGMKVAVGRSSFGGGSAEHVDMEAINTFWKNEPSADDFNNNNYNNHSSSQLATTVMEVCDVNEIVKQELRSCLSNISRRIHSLGVFNKESLRNLLQNSNATHQSDLFTLLLQLTVSDSTDVESASNSSASGAVWNNQALQQAANELFDEALFGEDIDDLLLQFENEEKGYLPRTMSAPASVAVKVEPGLISLSPTSSYVFGQVSNPGISEVVTAEESPSISSSVKSSSIKRQRSEDDIGYYFASISECADDSVSEVTSALKQLSAVVPGDNYYVGSNVASSGRTTPQYKLQKSKSNSNVSDYSKKCHV